MSFIDTITAEPNTQTPDTERTELFISIPLAGFFIVFICILVGILVFLVRKRKLKGKNNVRVY